MTYADDSRSGYAAAANLEWRRPTPPERVLLRFGRAVKITWLHLDFVLITLWFIVTAAQFRNDELLLYPLALYFVGSLVLHRDATWPIFQRGLLLLFLPLWWLTSSLWSPEPALAFRGGLQSTLTILICMVIAARLTTRQFLLVILCAMTVLALRSLPQGLLDFSLGKPSKAIYSHKNSLGMAMSVLFATTLATMLSPRISSFFRLFALGVAPIALFLVFASKSATAILISIGLAGIVLGSQLFLGSRNQISAGRVLLIAATIAAIAIAAALAFNFLQEDPVDLVLEALGKDRGLTGRTDLWSIGMAQLAENPYFGVGAEGFWQYHSSADVRQIFIDYHKTASNTFYFHNSWLEIGVALGWPGVLTASAATLWAVGTLLRRAVFIGGSEHWVLIAIAIAIVIRTMTESDLFRAFNMLHMLLWTGALIQVQKSSHLRGSI